jgi:Second Messenger Oligonucleotide or Dinucleotide Synthetase domain
VGYVDEAFLLLKQNLEITPTELELAKTRHARIRDHIETEWTLIKSFLTGSYDRKTKTKKLKDVDIFVVIDPDGPQGYLANGTGRAAVDALRNVLKTKWDDVKADDYVVTVYYAGEEVASYEVAPVFPRAGGGYVMPRGNDWMDTDPDIHADLVTAKNKECDEKFVPFIKMAKGINREAGDPISPSFLIEVMALELVAPPFGRYQDELRWFLASVADQIINDWPDPAGLGPDVNSQMASVEREQLADVVRGWLQVSEQAVRQEDAGNERAAVETWRKLFGNRMPRP